MNSPAFKAAQLFNQSRGKTFIRIVQHGGYFGQSLVLSHQGIDYTFNCPELHNRALVSNFSSKDIDEIRLMRERRRLNDPHVFFTRAAFENISGILENAVIYRSSKLLKKGIHRPLDKLQFIKNHPSVDVRISMHLHGPPHIPELIFATMPYGVNNLDIDLVDKSFEREPLFTGQNCEIQSIPIFRSESRKPTAGVVADMINSIPALRKHYHSINNCAVAYSCSFSHPGQIDYKKCRELKVPAGEKLNELICGNDIVLENGQKICSEEVMIGAGKPNRVLVLECADESYMSSMIEGKAIENAIPDLNSFDAVCHMTPSDLLNSKTYRTWLKLFDSATHIAFNQSQQCFIPHLARVFPIHHQLDAQIFPRTYADEAIEQNSNLKTEISSKPKIHTAEPSAVFTLFPMEQSGYQVRKNEDIEYENLDEDEMSTNDIYRRKFSAPSENNSLNRLRQSIKKTIYPEIVFLGTSSSRSTKTRNSSGILVQYSKDSYGLFDCGWGTYLQILTMFGPERTKHILQNLRMIFISHLHSDHLEGIFTLAKKRIEAVETSGQKAPLKKTVLIGPSQIGQMLKSFSRLNGDITHFSTFTPLNTTVNKAPQILDNVAQVVGLKRIVAVSVNHGARPFGIVITTKTGKKIVYSGDTRPDHGLIQQGMDADILIHEATFNSNQGGTAKMARHSTISEAVEVGQAMRAKNVILTHFPVVMARMPLIFEKFSPEMEKKLIVAYDFMILRWSDLGVARQLLPHLRKIYEQYYAPVIRKQELVTQRKRIEQRR